MTSLPPTQDIDTLPDGAAVITDEVDIDISASDEASGSYPSRRPFDEEPTRKAHAPKPPRKSDDERTDVVDVSSWGPFRGRDDEN